MRTSESSASALGGWAPPSTAGLPTRVPTRKEDNSTHWDSATSNDATCLTPREMDVLRLIARGCTYKQAADRLGVSLHTVASHTKNTYRKLGVRSSAAAVMQAVTMQLLG